MEDEHARRRLDRIAWWLDDAFRLPGGYRVGLDGFIGLVPGIGDAAGLVASSYVILQAYRLGAPAPMLMRMTGNVVLELLVGVVPVLGDLFDFVFKANRRNVTLLTESFTAAPSAFVARQGLPTRKIGIAFALLVAVVLALLVAVGWLGYRFLSFLIGLI